MRAQHALSLIGVTGAHRLPPAWFGGNYPFSRGPVVFRQFLARAQVQYRPRPLCSTTRSVYQRLATASCHPCNGDLIPVWMGGTDAHHAHTITKCPSSAHLRGILLCDLPGRPNRRGNDISDVRDVLF